MGRGFSGDESHSSLAQEHMHRVRSWDQGAQQVGKPLLISSEGGAPRFPDLDLSQRGGTLGEVEGTVCPKLGPGQQVVMKFLKPGGHKEGTCVTEPQRGMSLSSGVALTLFGWLVITFKFH